MVMVSNTTSTIPKSLAGTGRIALLSRDSEIIYSELSCTYPLKLLALRTTDKGIATAYMVSYGGGLVCGDQIALEIDVGRDARLLLLSQVRSSSQFLSYNELRIHEVNPQGSTKVFKTRPGQRAATSHETTLSSARQRLTVHIADKGALFLLPDPVTCFKSASYHQLQTFHLSGQASAVLLDWFTSGRRSRGEEWQFARYLSVNEVFVDGVRIARDATLLEGDAEEKDVPPLPKRSLADRLAPYACYATLILYGPLVEGPVKELDERYHGISVFRQREPPGLIWSLSPVKGEEGRIVRIAGKETEDVKVWLKEALRPLEGVIGVDVYRRAFV